jgi:nucleoside-diphosphate-sugar epimerase
MHVLVLGGTGLISTAITRQLDAAGHDVTVCNRGETEADLPESVGRVRADRFGDDFPANVSGVDPDVVIDMLCFSESDARLAIEAFEGRIEQYVMTSTIDVYRRPVDANPVSETAPRRPPTSDYGRQKAEAEDAFRAAHDRGAFATTILRPWTTYGPQGDGGLCHTLGIDANYLRRMREGKPIVVHGDGTGLWGPCHRRDVAAAFVGAVGERAAYGEAYNVTAEAVPTWNEYYRTLAAALDAPDPELVHVPTELLLESVPDHTGFLADHGRYSTTFDTTKARRDLGFRQSISLERGAREVIEFLDAEDRIDGTDEAFDALVDGVIETWRETADGFAESA